MTLPTRFRQAERLASRAIDGKGVVIVIDRQELHTFNSVGMRVFELADGRTAHEIAEHIAQEFEVDVPRALVDTEKFISELEELGVVVKLSSADSEVL